MTMEQRRLEIQKMLCDILGCPIEGPKCRCYFEPPPNIRMTYPAIVYHLNNVDTDYADDRPHRVSPIYICTLISKNPVNDLIERLLWLPKVGFERTYIADNLHHWVFTIY